MDAYDYCWFFIFPCRPIIFQLVILGKEFIFYSVITISSGYHVGDLGGFLEINLWIEFSYKTEGAKLNRVFMLAMHFRDGEVYLSLLFQSPSNFLKCPWIVLLDNIICVVKASWWMMKVFQLYWCCIGAALSFGWIRKSLLHVRFSFKFRFDTDEEKKRKEKVYKWVAKLSSNGFCVLLILIVILHYLIHNPKNKIY
jgi:hypothetical protein